MKTSYLISLICVLALGACSSQKNLQSDISLSVDSVAQSSQHRTLALLDTMGTRFSLDFDTLEISVERQVATVPEIVRIKAVKGRVDKHNTQYQAITETHNRLDTVAYKMSTTDSTTEHSATTRVYDPPKTTSFLLVLVLIGGLAYLYLRSR